MEAEFDDLQCDVDEVNTDLRDYGFEADYMSTERFSGILLVMIQKHRVNVEETDGLTFRFSLDDLLQSAALVLDQEQRLFVLPDPSVALVLPVSPDQHGTNAALSLFQTCPEFPTHPVLAGQLTLTTLTIAEDPDDTGRMEHITGTLTATLTRANAEGRVGTLRSVFDFAPPRRPLTDFQ